MAQTAKLMQMICLAGVMVLVTVVSTCRGNLMKEPHFCLMAQELIKIKMAFLMGIEVVSILTTPCQQIRRREWPKMEQMKAKSNDL